MPDDRFSFYSVLLSNTYKNIFTQIIIGCFKKNLTIHFNTALKCVQIMDSLSLSLKRLNPPSIVSKA